LPAEEGDMETSAIRVKGMKIVMAILLMVLTGCASNYKDFKVSNVDDDEGIAIGKVKVVYNGRSYNDECRICINSTCHELTKEGFVFMSLDQGTANIEELYCKDGGEQNQSFENTQFKVEPGVNYFGNLIFRWKNSNPSGGSAALGMFGLVGGLIAAAVEAPVDGEIKMTVKDDMSSVINVYRQQVGGELGPVRKSIAIVGHQATQ
jgi:putative hemolysin